MTDHRTFRRAGKVVEAIQANPLSLRAVEEFVGGDVGIHGNGLVIATRRGPLFADIGDWIVRDAGEFHAIPAAAFGAIYRAEATTTTERTDS